jgi:hypothetical protein
MSTKYWINNLGGNPYYLESETQPNEVCIEVPSPRPPRTPEGDYYWHNGEWILTGFMDTEGNYYEGDLQMNDQVVPRRPSHLHTWDGMQWVFDNNKALESIRQQRDQLLKESDYTDSPNTPLDPEVKTQWITYRQQLRDFPATCDPNNLVWPEKPPYVKQPIDPTGS